MLKRDALAQRQLDAALCSACSPQRPGVGVASRSRWELISLHFSVLGISCRGRLGEDLAEARRDLAAARGANEAQARQLQDATTAIAALHTAVCGNGQLPALGGASMSGLVKRLV